MLSEVIQLIRHCAHPEQKMSIVLVTIISESKDRVLFRNALGDEVEFLRDDTWWCWYPSGHKVSPEEQTKLEKAWKRHLKRKSINESN